MNKAAISQLDGWNLLGGGSLAVEVLPFHRSLKWFDSQHAAVPVVYVTEVDLSLANVRLADPRSSLYYLRWRQLSIESPPS